MMKAATNHVSDAEREEDDSENGRTYARKGYGGARLTDTRTRFIPDGDLLLMGALHHDHAAHCSPLHKLYAPAEENRSYT
jgi:hypothetical protein